MTKVLVLYYSSYGHIETMASAVASGAREVGATAAIRRVPELVPESVAARAGYKIDQSARVATIAELADYDAIIIGTPTRFGNMASQMKNFLDQAGRKSGRRLHLNREPAWRTGDNDPVHPDCSASPRHDDRRLALQLQGPDADGRNHGLLAIWCIDPGR